MRPHRRIRFLLAGLLALCLFPNLSWAGVSVPTPPPSETPPIAPILLARTNPVTFAFEATIVDLGFGANRQLLFPIPLMPGDTIRGEFAYDFKLVGNGVFQHQDGGLDLKLGVLELFSPTFVAFLQNNGSITAGDYSSTTDSFGFHCHKTTLCKPSPIDGVILFSWSAYFNLVDTSASLLDTHAQRPDLAVLNSFSRRNLILTFISEESGLSTGTVFAEVGPLVLIPEPSSVLLLIFSLAALAITRRRMKLNAREVGGGRMIASKFLPLIALVSLAIPAQAALAPIVFDFEDGLQGWIPARSGTRVQTELLGGDWAVFGIDGSEIRLDIDLTDVEMMTLDRLFTGPNPRRQNFVFVRVRNPLIPVGGSTLLLYGDSLLATEADSMPNPDTRWFDLTEFSGIRTVIVDWNALACGLPEESCFDINFPGYVDNITFHPVPEPSSLALLAFGLVALVIARRRVV